MKKKKKTTSVAADQYAQCRFYVTSQLVYFNGERV